MKIKYQKKRLKYSLLLFLILVIAILIFAILKDTNQKKILCDDCNLILIGIDTLRADRVSYYNYDRNLTPTLDSLAEDSYLFKNTITQASWTLPSFMSLFTSTYPSQHKVTNKFYINDKGNISISDSRVISPHMKTLTELLKQKGYKTAGFTGDAGVGSEFGFDKGFDEYYDKDRFGGFNKSFSLAESWISENKNRKFFVFIHGYDCHGDFEINHEKRLYSEDSKSNYTGSKEEEIDLREQGLKEGFLNLSKNDLDFWKNLYDDKILNMDKQLSKFIGYLKNEGLMNNTIIVIVSDHGEEFLEHGKIDHGATLYDEVIKAVFMIKIPESNKKIINNQVRLIDVMPTILNLLNLKIPEQTKNQIQGKSLVSLMLGKSLKLDAVSETNYRFFVSKKSIRTQDGWKFVIDFSSGQEELYDLKTDSSEKNNLAVLNKYKIDELKRKMDYYISKEIIQKPNNELFLKSEVLNKFELTSSINLNNKELFNYINDNEHLKVERYKNIDMESSKTLTEREVILIQSIFSDSISPYPGEITNKIECQNEFKPHFFKTGVEERQYLITFSNDRFNLGVCSEDITKFRCLIGWLYCSKKKELYKISYFIPLEESDEKLHDLFISLKCNN